jgi:hypothetical protein
MDKFRLEIKARFAHTADFPIRCLSPLCDTSMDVSQSGYSVAQTALFEEIGPAAWIIVDTKSGRSGWVKTLAQLYFAHCAVWEMPCLSTHLLCVPTYIWYSGV